jgi:hypothetical protein
MLGKDDADRAKGNWKIDMRLVYTCLLARVKVL